MQSDLTQQQVDGESSHRHPSADAKQCLEATAQQAEFSLDGEDSACDFGTNSFYREWIDRCTAYASDYATARIAKDLRARQYLQTIAECVHSKQFELHNFAEFIGQKVSKADRKNPHRFLMQIVDPGRDPKVVSKQAQALIYALTKCDNDPSRLEKFFSECSIKECLRQKAAEKKEATTRRIGQNTRLIIADIPQGLSGVVTITIKIENGKASFVCLVGNDDMHEIKTIPYVSDHQENQNYPDNA